MPARLLSGSTSTYRVRYSFSRSATVAGRSNFVSRSIGTRGSFPETISAMNFGSQTFSASCLDVTGAVAPRASAKSSTGIRYRSRLCMTSNHHGCSQRGLALQPLLRQGFRTAIQVLLSVTKPSLEFLDESSRGHLRDETSFLGCRRVA